MQADQIDYEKVMAGSRTKSDKIRALSRHGVSTAEIARILDIRYQHARNVLLHAGLHRTGRDKQEGEDSTGPASLWLTLDAEGRLALPPEMLRRSGLKPGARVYLGATEDGLELLSAPAALGRAQAIVAPFVPPGRSLVDEFIADRHREAENE